MERGLGSPDTSSAVWCSSSASKLRMNQWLSFTSTRVAPAASAPSTAALASAVMRRRNRAYSAADAGDPFHVDGDVDAHRAKLSLVFTLYYKVLDKRGAT